MSVIQGWRLRDKVNSGEPILNAFLSLSDTFAAEVLAAQGWHSLTVDRQHGRNGPSGLWDLALAIAARGASPMIRVSQLDDAEVLHALDAGFEGVICPMVNTPEEARRLVRACRYPPAGIRSYGPTRAALGREADFVGESASQIVVLAMIETGTALANLDEILGESDIDGIYVGPADLAISLGRQPSLDDTSPEFLDMLTGIAQKVRDHGKLAGVYCASVEYAHEMIECGFRLVTIGSDVRFLRGMGSSIVHKWQSR